MLCAVLMCPDMLSTYLENDLLNTPEIPNI